MKIAILGAGFTGLAAALRLLEQGHEVTIFDRESELGGLATGFKQDQWQWSLEKSYHHWFTNDSHALNLAQELNHKIITVRPKTNVYINKQILQLDSPLSLLTFPHLPLVDRLRVGAATLYLKLISNHKLLEGQKALPWIRKYMGQTAASLIWEPLFSGKFGSYQEDIALSWFWARIKKRTPSLAYPEGGFKLFAQNLADKITSLGGQIYLDTEVLEIKSGEQKCVVIARSETTKQSDLRDSPRRMTVHVDKVIVTLPSPIFTKITPQLPPEYIKKISSIPHLHALNLILVLKKPFMDKTYWLNITDKTFPFLVLAEHTNFMDPQHYGNQHLLFIGNYLPQGHPYLKMTAKELLKIFDPYLKKINPDYDLQTITYHLFKSPFAQPIVTVDYPQLIPTMETPLNNIYLANLDMVYPWDRGTNYAIEMGEKVAKLV